MDNFLVVPVRKCGNDLMNIVPGIVEIIMECPLCGHHKPHKHGKTSKGTQGYYCPECGQTFTLYF